jgi:hypothetical protein
MNGLSFCFFLYYPSTFTYPNPYPNQMEGYILLVQINTDCFYF